MVDGAGRNVRNFTPAALRGPSQVDRAVAGLAEKGTGRARSAAPSGVGSTWPAGFRHTSRATSA